MQLQFKLLDDQSSKKFVLNIKYQSYDQFLQNKDSFKLEKKDGILHRLCQCD